ncbi:aldo/keto reductase [Cryptosporangium phraense]|uniref:Aldo/keto reductase n=1 Tax=Cryptosporangium phraense TaxID=2593070 RepID=A0A545AG80_9ACTN|nr:aldo/keto reductase [Cryptosporangium phraense]TQS40270.1 aldo/keto reductase [Cryptosporangium phraense]
MNMPLRALGASGLTVSRLALGSWRTFERISREQGIAVMQAARDAGITFLDDARYDDETGSAPIPTGYSEVVFGELFRAAGWERDEVVVANKLWWEFWPEQSAAAELDASLQRMGLDHVDLIYAEAPPAGLEIADAVGQIVELIRAGKARAWGVLNWTAEQVLEAAQIADMDKLPGPAAAQLPYSLVRRDVVEDDHLIRSLAAANTAVVASYALAGGLLTGKYAAGGDGRHSGDRSDPRFADALAAGDALAALAADLHTDAATLALAFPLLNPAVASVLFGATRPEQVWADINALELAETLDETDADRLRAIALPAAAA